MPKLFLDLDGVLADFDDMVKRLTGSPPEDIGDDYMWEVIRRHETFFLDLRPMQGAMKLWAHARQYNPTILTGCTPGQCGDYAREHKIEWCAINLGHRVPVIVCLPHEKCKHITAPGDILVDDRDKYAGHWKRAGGVFIHHRDPETTIANLFVQHNRITSATVRAS